MPRSRQEKLALLSSMIPCPCNFDEGGKCSKYRNLEFANSNNKMACCGDCFHYRGYYCDERFPEDLAHLFKEGTGFWREGSGCALPRERRSITCLSYSCFDTQDSSFGVLSKKIRFGKIQPDRRT